MSSSVSRPSSAGEPSTSSVADWLRACEAASVTGRVQVDSSHGAGELALVAGQVVEARFAGATGRAALLSLMVAREGTFRLSHELVESKAPLVLSPLAISTEQIAEWRRLTSLAPALSSVFRLTFDGMGALRSAPGDLEAATLRAFDGRRDLCEVIEASGLDAWTVLRVVLTARDREWIADVASKSAAPHSAGEFLSSKPLDSGGSLAWDPLRRASLGKTTAVGIGPPAPEPIRRREPEARRLVSTTGPVLASPIRSIGPASPSSSPLPAAPTARASTTPVPAKEPAVERARRSFGRYEIVCALGSGGMGAVYLCRLISEGGFRRLFAIKILRSHLKDNSDAERRFLQEARICGQLRHPNVVDVIDAGVEGSQPYLVMDYVEGGTLAELLAHRAGVRSPQLVLPLVLDALAGLHAAHTLIGDDGTPQRIVHCDVSPENLLVGTDGICRVTDFGVARNGFEQQRHATAMGRPGYLAPEQILSQPVDARADVWAMGVILYRALTGVAPFECHSVEDTLRQVCTKRVEPPSAVGLRPPPCFDFACMRALEREPDRRYASAEEMMLELRRIAMRENLLGTPSQVGSCVREAVGRTLAERRLAVLEASKKSSFGVVPALPVDAAPASTASHSGLPELPELPAVSSSQTIALPEAPRAKKSWAILTASVLAAVLVLVTLLFPKKVSRLFRLNTDAAVSDTPGVWTPVSPVAPSSSSPPAFPPAAVPPSASASPR